PCPRRLLRGRRRHTIVRHRGESFGRVLLAINGSDSRLEAGFQGVQMKIERTAMEAALAALLCVPSRAPLVFDESFSLTSEFGAGAVPFLDFLMAELDQGSPSLRAPIVANRWLEGFLFHLILSGSTRARSLQSLATSAGSRTTSR